MPLQAELVDNAHSMDQIVESVDINDLSTKNEKKKVARRRWAILAKALKVLFSICVSLCLRNSVLCRVLWEVNPQVLQTNFLCVEFLPSCSCKHYKL